MLFTTLLLPLAVSGAILDTRQAGAKLAGVETLQPKFRKTATRQLLKYGPYKLKASGGGKGGGLDSTLMGQSFILSIKEGFCNHKTGQGCTVLAGKVGLQYVDGKPANPSNGVYIHHILSSDTTKKQSAWLSSCNKPSSAGMSINQITGGTGFVGTGEDSSDGGAVYTNDDGTANTGYHVAAKDNFVAWAQIVNYNTEAKDIYITYDYEWVPGIVGDDIKSMLLSVTSCSSMIKMSEAGPTNTTSGKFYFMEDGHVVRARGHLHDGGVQMDLYINDKYKCTSKATYGSNSGGEGGMGGMGGSGMGGSASGMGGAGGSPGGHSHGTVEKDGSSQTISGMSTCWGPWPVKKGDYMVGNAQYDLKKHPLRKTAGGGKAADVMGLWTINFVKK